MTVTGDQAQHVLPQHEIVVREVTSAADLDEVMRIRDEVFVHEQALTDDAGHDPDDSASVHFMAWLDGQPVGTGRLTMFGREAQVAWVAVRKPQRGSGVGKAIMETIIEHAWMIEATHVILNAQTHALNFYRNLGFEVVGTEFFMSGIGHYVMVRRF